MKIEDKPFLRLDAPFVNISISWSAQLSRDFVEIKLVPKCFHLTQQPGQPQTYHIMEYFVSKKHIDRTNSNLLFDACV